MAGVNLQREPQPPLVARHGRLHAPPEANRPNGVKAACKRIPRLQTAWQSVHKRHAARNRTRGCAMSA